MKKTILLTAAVVLLTAGLAYGHGNGWRGGYGGHMMGPGYGGQMMGPGMMGPGYGGQGMGPGMMGPGYGGRGMGPGYGGNFGSCPCGAWFGQDYQDSDAYRKFMNDTVDLRRKLNEKRFEYREAWRQPGTSREDLDSLERDIFDLQQQLQEKAQQYR